MKSKTIERFKDGKFYIMCEIPEENVTIRKICRENGLNVVNDYGHYSGHPLHHLAYVYASFLGKEILLASNNSILSMMTAKDFIRNVREEMNNFKKSDLVLGVHVAKFRHGEIRLYLGNGFINGDGNASLHINNLDNDLRFIGVNDNCDIIEIFEIKEITNSCSISLDTLLHERNLISIWKREEKSKARIEYEKLQEQIKQLQEQANKLESEIR